ncbi:Ribokinase-like protein [Poronia punctata]|nr:Ribokinase-like protein [Poronia punctata]
MTTNLVCVGACYLDTILSVPHYPEEDSKLRASNLQIRRGGNCPNTLQVLQQLLRDEYGANESADISIRPYLVTCLPRRDGRTTKTIIESFGPDTLVDFSRCIFRQANQEPASSYIIRSAATGSRTLVNYNNLDEMTFQEFVAAVDDLDSEAATWFHFEGRIPATTLQCVQWLRRSRPKARVSVEVEKPGREGLEELAAVADVVFFSRSWAENKRYKTAEECLGGQSANVRGGSYLFCTWGSQGAACLLPDGTTESSPATLPGQTIHVIDSVGAGDTFIAGILFGFLCHGGDWDLRAKLGFAVQLATRKVQQEGLDNLGFEPLGRLTRTVARE